jgi:hypothetical protein
VKNEQKIVKKLCGFLLWKNYQVVFYFGKNFKWFFILEKKLCGFFIWNQRFAIVGLSKELFIACGVHEINI